jgi:AbrB family looped-hinge helix DNA binding protein
MYRAKITAKGQLTLPKELRAKLGLRTGDYIKIRETKEGYVLEKELDERRFHKYAGLLRREGDSDEIIKELRGE